ncbi:MAG: polyamine aminopropyltransferase [bacterium]|nr:MAG: polyamine aminopropyltransferase [bacterium]
MDKMKDQWFGEDHNGTIEPKYTHTHWKIKKTLFTGQSPFQKLDFLESYDHGIIFTLDGLIMTSERDEFIYHEMLTHVSLYTHPDPKKVLVIGGGDCGALREILKHPAIEKIHLCEIDKMVVEKCEDIFPYVREVLKNPRIETFYEDGFHFLENNTNTYDIILVDSTDPIGEAVKLFEVPFLRLCYKALTADGMMVTQCGSPFYQTRFIKDLQRVMKSVFPLSQVYTASVHSYPGGYWGFLTGSRKYDPVKDFQVDKYRDLNFKYYNDLIHRAAFALPSYFVKQDS